MAAMLQNKRKSKNAANNSEMRMLCQGWLCRRLKEGAGVLNRGNFGKVCQTSPQAIYLMLGRSVASKFIYVRPVAGPESA